MRPSRLFILLFFVFSAAFTRADVSLAPLFADHAVLQRDKPVPVWGWAGDGEHITVTFHGQSGGATAAGDGRWIVYLNALPASAEPADLTVTGKNKIIVHDVLVGDVWLCSGQSNMEFAVYNPTKTTFRIANAGEEIAAANFPLIRHFKVNLAESSTPVDTMTGSWAVCSPDTVSQFTAVGYFFARDIYEKLHVPIGLINCTWGGTPVEAWMSAYALDRDPAFAFVHERWQKTLADYPTAEARYEKDYLAWEKSAVEAKAAGKAFTEAGPKLPHGPGDRWTPIGIFNGMVNPLLPCALRGVLWYQGESNASHPTEYHELFAAMITAWRAHFGQGDLPFYFVQLANYSYLKNTNGTEWALIREGQTQTLTLPQTAMAVIIDLGESHNIHPRNKQEVGRRLALIAENRLYGLPGDDSGPMFAGATQEGRAFRVHFTHSGNGLVAHDTPVQSLELAGTDKVFHPAQGRIEGDTLLVSSPDVKDPVAVRYAWRNDPVANLFNGAGLPAAPFRSDAW
jgi:sialate O-acetylesterase